MRSGLVRSSARRALAAIAVFALAACTATEPEPARPTSLIGTTPSAATPLPSSGPATVGGDTTTRLTPPPGGSFLVRTRYPVSASRCKGRPDPFVLARYPGSLRVTRSDDGTLAVTVTLPFERYLEGIAEVPPTWPRAALEAQAIAARSYSLATTGWSGAQGDTLREPICATASCQVYGGIPVPPERAHHRWVRAVRRTAGQVLLYGDRPADTVYFSTSNGRTYGNDEVFGSPPLPYLRPVVERDDGASTTSRWQVRVPFADLTRFLRAAGTWSKGTRISKARVAGGIVILRGGGARKAIEVGELRDAINVWAPCLAPHRYPGRLPITIPSRWLTVSASGGALLARGRGWGHGVGMVQWGAYGKARRGLSAEEILAYYYGGLRPRTYPEPGLIHVQVVSGATALRVVPSRLGARMNGATMDGPVVIEGR